MRTKMKFQITPIQSKGLVQRLSSSVRVLLVTVALSLLQYLLPLPIAILTMALLLKMRFGRLIRTT